MTEKFPLMKKTFTFPFKLHPYQEEGVEEIECRACSLAKYKVGLGKTAISVFAALHASLTEDVEQVLVLAPPVLLDQWYDFLQEIKGIPSVLIYRGTPAARKKMDIESTAVVLVSYNIFRQEKEFKRFEKLAAGRKLCIIADEFSAKSLGKTYKKLKKLVFGKIRTRFPVDRPNHKLIALNATPVSDPVHIYNWDALFGNMFFLSLNSFKSAHVDKQDPWGGVTAWKNLDLLHEIMDGFSVDTEHEVELPELVRTVTPYELTPEHLKLYKEVKQKKLDELPEDKVHLVVDALFCALQEVTLMPSLYGGDNIKPPILDYLESTLDQIGTEDGVLIYTRHVAVSKMLAEKIPNSVAIYGGVSKKAREEAFAKLKSGEVKILIGNLDSLGAGLNLQMLNYTIYVEYPFKGDKLVQSLGRTHRQGQKKNCFAMFPMAKGTIQESIYYKNLVGNVNLINQVMKSKSDVIDFLS